MRPYLKSKQIPPLKTGHSKTYLRSQHTAGRGGWILSSRPVCATLQNSLVSHYKILDKDNLAELISAHAIRGLTLWLYGPSLWVCSRKNRVAGKHEKTELTGRQQKGAMTTDRPVPSNQPVHRQVCGLTHEAGTPWPSHLCTSSWDQAIHTC